MRPAIRPSRTSGFALGLLTATALVELLVVALASTQFDEVADASRFGRPGTAIACTIAAAVAVGGVVVAYGARARSVRFITAISVFVVVSVVALMALFMSVASGPETILAILLGHTAVSITMIGRAAVRPRREVKR